jgi:serine/threonine-protein kinase
MVFEPPPKLSALCPDAPEGLEFLLNRALEKDPAKRFQNAGELKEALSVCRRVAPASGGIAAPNAEKTILLTTPAPLPDNEKTQVFQRLKAMPIAAPPKPAPPPPPPPAVAKPSPGLRFRYCPSCTSANPPDATVCSRCGLPLAAGPSAAAKSTNWGMYIAVGVAAVLAVVLVIVLMAKRG